MTDRLARLNAWLEERHAVISANVLRLPTMGSLFRETEERWERENDEHNRRMKELDSGDEGMAETVYGDRSERRGSR